MDRETNEAHSMQNKSPKLKVIKPREMNAINSVKYSEVIWLSQQNMA